MAYLVTGGARSGKSAFAEALCARMADRGVYIATCKPHDGEMAARVALHRSGREAGGFAWETVEEPMELAELLRTRAAEINRSGGRPPVLLVDCLTLWLSNRLLASEGRTDDEGTAGALDAAVEELTLAAAGYPYPLVLVTNEVGSGIVPAYPLGRRFRDEAGRLNRRMADVCERVFLVTAGIPVELKSIAFRWEDL